MAINYPQGYDDDFLNTIKTVIDHVNAHGKTIQDLVADGQLTEEQYAELIAVINGNLKSGEVDINDLVLNLQKEINKISQKIDKGNVTVDDIDLNQGKITPNMIAESLLQMIAGTADINAVPADNSITNVKMTDHYAGNGILPSGQNLDLLTREGVYFKETGSVLSNAPSNYGQSGRAAMIDVRSFRSDILVQKVYGLRSIEETAYFERYKRLGLFTEWYEVSNDNHLVDKLKDNTLRKIAHSPLIQNNAQQLSKDIIDMSYAIQSVEIEGADPRYPVKVWQITRNQDRWGYRIDIGQKVDGSWGYLATSNNADSFDVTESPTGLTYVEFHDNANDTTVKMTIDYRLIEDGGRYLDGASISTEPNFILRPDCIKKERQGSLPDDIQVYDQSLNTTDDVKFASLEVGGDIPTGTLSNPPSELLKGDVWADTTDSSEHPILRVVR